MTPAISNEDRETERPRTDRPRLPAPARRPRVLFINRSYWPDAEATGQLLTELCQDLSADFDVSVLVGQPNHNLDQDSFRATGYERRNNVAIHRVRHTRFNKARLAGRAANLLTYLAGATWKALRLERPDIVVVETDPPLLCMLGGLLRRRRGVKLVVYLQDIYPDLAVALGKLRDGPLTRRLGRAMQAVYRQADRVVVLSRDMRAKVIGYGVRPARVATVPNWVDTRIVAPRAADNSFRVRHGLADNFVVMYSGNLGLTQPLDDVLAAANLLRDRGDIAFLLVGEGASKSGLQASAARQQLTNVRFLPYQPKSELADSLSAADLQLVPLDPRLVGCLMPSKLYGILAAGRPVLAIAPPECELAQVTLESGAGIVVPPGDPAALAASIVAAAADPVGLAAMGRRARRRAVEQYDRRIATARFAQLLHEVAGEGRLEASTVAVPAAVSMTLSEESL